MVNYVETTALGKELFVDSNGFPRRLKGQRTGSKTPYTEGTLMWGHWVGTTVLFRPELRFDHSFRGSAHMTMEPAATSFSWRWTSSSSFENRSWLRHDC